MSESQKTRFVDGLRITPLHLTHAQSTAEQAVLDLRGVIGLGRVGYGFRLVVSEDAKAVTLSPGVGFTPSGLRLSLDEGVELEVPDGDGPFSVVLHAENHDEPGARLGDEPTVIDLIRRKRCDLVINTPEGRGARTDGYAIREAALSRRIPCITTMAGAAAAVHAIANARAEGALSLQERIDAETRTA